MCLVPSLHAWRVWYSALFLGGRMKRGPKQKKTIENRSGEERSTQFRGLEMNLACQLLTKGDGLGVKSSESTLANRILLRPPTSPAALRMNMCNDTRTLTSPDPSLPSQSIVMGAKIGSHLSRRPSVSRYRWLAPPSAHARILAETAKKK